MVEKLTLTAGRRDERGRMLVVATLGKLTHKHKFDPDSQFHRRQFREAVVSKFNLPEDSHSAIEELLTAAAAAADSATDLWSPELVTMSDVTEKPVDWFWGPSYIPAGSITLLDADANEGKSTLAIDLAARRTRGDSMPPGTAPDGKFDRENVLLIVGEDSLKHTVKPRIVAAGGEPERFHVLQSLSCDGEDERIPQLPLDLSIIERIIAEKKIAFIVIDVFSCFLQPGLSMNSDEDMRRVTTPLAAMLDRTRATCLLLRHLNKKENLRSMYRGGGSVAIVAAARAAFTIGSHPEEPGVKVFAPVKHNLGPRPHSLTFEIEACGDSSRIRWGGQSDLTASEIMNPGKREGSKFDEAKADYFGCSGRRTPVAATKWNEPARMPAFQHRPTGEPGVP